MRRAGLATLLIGAIALPVVALAQEAPTGYPGQSNLVPPGMPTPTTAFELGARVDDPLAMYLSDIFTIPADLAGVPAVSVPCGTDGNGLPVGLQITGKVLDEATVLRVAHAFEQDLGERFVPPLVANLRQ